MQCVAGLQFTVMNGVLHTAVFSMTSINRTATLLNTAITCFCASSIRLAIHALQRTIDHVTEIFGIIAI